MNAKGCAIPWCGKDAKASGYCMRHYGVLWKAHLLCFQRRGVTEAQQHAEVRRIEARLPVKPTSAVHAHDRLVALGIELKWARMAYPIVCGWQKRHWWACRIKALEQDIAKLEARMVPV